MVYVKWTFWAVFWTLLVAFLHYTLPQTDIVRVTDTYERRIVPGANAMFWTQADTGDDTTSAVRDVFFIQTFTPGGGTRVYRNEDTGWGWPPYFKFNAANLHAEASDMRTGRDPEAAQWVAMHHYGWRNELLTIYPNAVGMTQVDGPDARIIPWFNIIVLTGLAVLFWAIRARWNKFWRRRKEWAADEWNDGTA